MENQALYENLYNQVKGNLNYREIQELNSLKEENIPVLEEKIQKLKGSIRFVRIAVIAILILIILSASLIQSELIPKLNHFLILFLIMFPISIGNAVVGGNSISALQKRIDTFEMMVILIKDEFTISLTG